MKKFSAKSILCKHYENGNLKKYSWYVLGSTKLRIYAGKSTKRGFSKKAPHGKWKIIFVLESYESFESGDTKSIISDCYNIWKLLKVGIPLTVPSECKTVAMTREGGLLDKYLAQEKEQSSSRDSYLDDYSDDSYDNFYNNPITSRIRNVRFN